MDSNWPPRGIEMPCFDIEDIRAVGWDGGQIGEGENAGSYVLQAGRCPEHFAIIFEPDARIIHREDGTMEMSGVTFSGSAVEHYPNCPSAKQP